MLKHIKTFIAIVLLFALTAFSVPNAKAKVKTISASGSVKVQMSSVGGYGQIPVEINLKSVKTSSYKGTIISYNQTKNIYVWNPLKSTTFTFTNIPANGQPMQLTLTFTRVDGKTKSISGIFSWKCSALFSCRTGKFGTYTYIYNQNTISYKKP